MASLASTIKTYEHWFHYGTFVHEPLKASLLNVFHNVSGDTSYNGLPSNPKDLYKELDQNHKATLTKLQRNGVLKQDQMLLIFPKNKQETYSDKFDVTLLVVLIINCCNIPPPVNGWKDKHPPISDISTGANVIRARELRNFFHHTDPKDFDEQTLDKKWLEGDTVVSALGYSYNSKDLKTATLDPTKLSVVLSLVQYLQINQDTSKKQIDSNTEASKTLQKKLDASNKQIDSLNASLEQMKKQTERQSVKKQLQHECRFEADTKEQLQRTKTMEKDLTDKLESDKKLQKNLIDAYKQIENLRQQMLHDNKSGIYTLFTSKPTHVTYILKYVPILRRLLRQT